jgi:hypothetical protein
MDKILQELKEERILQDSKWGEQNHPSVCPILVNRSGGVDGLRLCQEYSITVADTYRSWLKMGRNMEWATILMEEVAEAIECGGDELSMRQELIQVGAVVVAWIECIDRRLNKDKE